MKIYPYDIQDGGYAEAVKKIGVSECGAAIMKDRFAISTFLVTDISTPAANVVKQQLLSLGGEAAVPAHAIDCSKPKSSFFFSLRRDLCGVLAKRLRLQCWKLPQVAEFIEKFNRIRAPWFSFSFEGIDTTRPNLMGIINVTPDSFSDGGSYATVDDVLKRVAWMVGNGVDIVDVGGESTRPGAAFVDVETEIGRTVPVIRAICGPFPASSATSLGTNRSEVSMLSTTGCRPPVISMQGSGTNSGAHHCSVVARSAKAQSTSSAAMARANAVNAGRCGCNCSSTCS